MLKIATKTKLSPAKAIKRAVEFFGPSGYGLKDLGLEYTVRVQYVQHSGVLTGSGSEAKENPQC